MEVYVRELVSRHRRRGILVDTNLLLLFCVGGYDRGLVERLVDTGDEMMSPESWARSRLERDGGFGSADMANAAMREVW